MTSERASVNYTMQHFHIWNGIQGVSELSVANNLANKYYSF